MTSYSVFFCSELEELHNSNHISSNIIFQCGSTSFSKVMTSVLHSIQKDEQTLAHLSGSTKICKIIYSIHIYLSELG